MKFIVGKGEGAKERRKEEVEALEEELRRIFRDYQKVNSIQILMGSHCEKKRLQSLCSPEGQYVQVSGFFFDMFLKMGGTWSPDGVAGI